MIVEVVRGAHDLDGVVLAIRGCRVERVLKRLHRVYADRRGGRSRARKSACRRKKQSPADRLHCLTPRCKASAQWGYTQTAGKSGTETAPGFRLPRNGGRKPDLCGCAYASAIAAIEIFRPAIRTGNLAPWRAGGFDGNQRSHSSFKPAKSSSSARMTVALTILSTELP